MTKPLKNSFRPRAHRVLSGSSDHYREQDHEMWYSPLTCFLLELSIQRTAPFTLSKGTSSFQPFQSIFRGGDQPVIKQRMPIEGIVGCKAGSASLPRLALRSPRFYQRLWLRCYVPLLNFVELN